MADALVNFGYSTVATAPTPATTGTTLIVQAGDGTKFPTPPFDVTLYPSGTAPLISNAEIARCTSVSTDTLTLTRGVYGTTKQSVAVGWVVDNAVTANLLSQFVAVSNYAPAGKNLILNGGMEINQRASSSYTGVSGTATYGLDRWCFESSAANTTFAQSTSSPPTGMRYFQSVTNTSATSTTWALSQSLETNNVVPLQGKTVTVSFQYQIPTNFSNTVQVYLKYSTGTDANLLNAGTIILPSGLLNMDNNGTIFVNSSWSTAYGNFVIPSNATSLAIQFNSGGSTVNGAQFNVTAVQMEVGATVTPFIRQCNNYQDELAGCQRFYLQINSVGNSYTQFGQGLCGSTTQAIIQIQYPVQMRGNTTLNTSGSFLLYDGANVYTSISSIAINNGSVGPTSAVVYVNGSSYVQYRSVVLEAYGSTATYMAFNAEL